MGIATTQAFSRLLAPGLRKVFFDEFKLWEEEYSKFLNINTSTRAYEEELVMSGLGRFERKQQGKSILYDDMTQGNAKRYTHVSFGLGFRVTREMYQDDLYNIMKKATKELANAARQTYELEAAGLLDDAFTGATYTGADGLALCHTAHILTGSPATYPNKPTTDVDIGVGALRASAIRMERTVSERGLPENRGQGKTIVISPTFQFVLKEILGSELKPYTADNEINAMKDMNLTYFVSHYMSDEDAWFNLSDKAKHDLKFFWRMKPVFENSDDFDTKDAKFSGFMRFSLGFTDWRGVDGSSGGA
jgi:hypothetical protein